MKKWLVLFLISLTVALSIPVLAIECDGTPPSDSSQLVDYIKKCEQNLIETQGQKQTLNSAITVINSKINLAQGQINQTQSQIDSLEEEVSLLSTILVDLNKSLDQLSVTYAARVRESYKQRDLNPLKLFFSSDSFAQLVTKLKYLNSVKNRDRLILQELEKARLDYDQQKLTKEKKQQEVEELKTKLVGQKTALGGQKSQKQELLTITKNDEKKYQELLDKAQAELAAIAAIIAGRGEEEKIRDVSEGERIASVLTSGPNLYACSTGPHLHFEVAKDNAHRNPFELLSSRSLVWANADPAQNGSGSWQWPINDPVKITQGYGTTSYSSRYANGIHTGIDMVNTGDYSVRSVKKGILYRGGISCRGGILQYVHVEHEEDGYSTYYLHVNYF
jgi:peptidoglycan hydrolase CwlO-like protein